MIVCLQHLFTNKSPQRCWFESHQGFWILSCGEVIHLAYRTTVVLLMIRCPLVHEIMHEGAHEVFGHQAGKALYDFNSVIAT